MNIKIKYNPFLKSTEILVDNQKPANNSSLHFGEKRLQEWAGELPQILVSELRDSNFSIEFTGTLADFEDLKLGLFMPNCGISIDNIVHYSTPSVAETEAEIDRIFEEIKNGPVEELKDSTILAAFQKAKDLRFEINVVATMSSGKSSLINALLATKLMPVANTATTATIVNIIDTDIEGYRGIAYDCEGNEIEHEEDLTYSIMKSWNKNEKISSIDIEGRIPCVNSVGMRLVLIDTPGPNNSADENHRALTFNMLNNSDKSLVLFVMRADNSGVDDEKAFLEYVCDCMNKGGKQSRDRYIFAINKLDMFDPEEEDIEHFLEKQKGRLEEKGIFQPNIFPVSALAALEARKNPEIEMVLPRYRQFIKRYPSTHFDSYYQFSHLPNIARAEIEQYLIEAANNPDRTEAQNTEIEIHSGIVSIEKAIELYINKYARTIKVYDLVQSFNNRLNELAAIATLEQSIIEDTRKKEELKRVITTIKDKIQSSESAIHISDIIEGVDIAEDVSIDIETCIYEYMEKINKIVYGYANDSEITINEAESQAEKLKEETDGVLQLLSIQISRDIEKSYIKLFENFVKRYEMYVKNIGMNIDTELLKINPILFVAENITDLSKILHQNTQNRPTGEYETKISSEPYTKKVWDPTWTHWFRTKNVTAWRSVKIQIPICADYVNMAEVVSKYIEPVQLILREAKEKAIEQLNVETRRIKESLVKQTKEINKLLEIKLTELQEATNSAVMTEQELERKKANLNWMNTIIERTNQLINF